MFATSFRTALAVIILLVFHAALPAIQTQEVNLGLAGSYDATVYVTRDAAGRMLFRDQQVTTPTTLFDLWTPGAFTSVPLHRVPFGNGLNPLQSNDNFKFNGNTLTIAAGNIHLTSTSLSGFQVRNANATFANAVTVGNQGNPNFYGNWDLTDHQSDPAKPSWGVRMNIASDAMQFMRAPAGAPGAGNFAEVGRFAADGTFKINGPLEFNGPLYRHGQRFVSAANLLDNPDFNIWQRNITVAAAHGGDAGATLTYPVPRMLTLGADRWQASRAGAAMTATISRAAPPGTLPSALYALKIEATAGNPCRFYIHQTVTRERTRALRGKWVTFAISHYMAGGTNGGNLALYKTVSGTVTELARFTFTSTSNAWDRLAIAAQIPNDADCLIVSIQPELSASGITTAYIANASLVEGKYVNTTERVTDPAVSSLPPISKSPAADLGDCQRFFEKGSLAFESSAPDSGTFGHYTSIHFNTAKADTTTIQLNNVSTAHFSVGSTSISEKPAHIAGQSWPQGFRAGFTGNTSDPSPFSITADWTAEVPEPM